MGKSIGRRIIGLLLLAASLSIPCFAQEIDTLKAEPVVESLSMDTGISLTWEDFVSTRESIRFEFDSQFFEIVAALSVNNDKKYGADIANIGDGTFFGNYFLMDEGGARLQGYGFTFEAGRFAQRDPVGGPYSLYINSGGPSTISARLAYDSGIFSYESVWLELTDDNNCKTVQWPSGFPDRGANIKTYTLFLPGGMSLGIQDAAVYTGRSFDFEYFVSPVPNYFIQYVKGTVGRPWTTGANENNLLGGFWKLDTELASFSFQGLIDDFSLHFIIPEALNTPWKAAWALDATLKTGFGDFGFHHAGATKHTFQPSVQDQSNPELMAYGYTYYPDMHFLVDGEYNPIAIEDNMVGYLHGENNLAFMLDWRGTSGGLSPMASLEYVISGAKSPANPWHELFGAVDYSGTKVIADARLEHRLVFTAQAERTFGSTRFYGSIKLGYVWNELRLEAPGGINPTPTFVLDDILIFRPSDYSRPIFAITIGMTASLDLVELLGLGRER